MALCRKGEQGLPRGLGLTPSSEVAQYLACAAHCRGCNDPDLGMVHLPESQRKAHTVISVEHAQRD